MTSPRERKPLTLREKEEIIREVDKNPERTEYRKNIAKRFETSTKMVNSIYKSKKSFLKEISEIREQPVRAAEAPNSQKDRQSGDSYMASTSRTGNVLQGADAGSSTRIPISSNNNIIDGYMASTSQTGNVLQGADAGSSTRIPISSNSNIIDGGEDCVKVKEEDVFDRSSDYQRPEDFEFSRSSKRARLWRYFSPMNSRLAKCMLCETCVKSSGKSSNLEWHLKQKHKEIFITYSDEKSSRNSCISLKTLQESKKKNHSLSAEVAANYTSPNMVIKATEHYPSDSLRSKKITDKLVHMICTDLKPLSVVEDKGFLEFVKELDSRYLLPERKTLCNVLIPNMYYLAVEDVKKLLVGVQSLSLTCDLWTSIANDSYVTVTAHAIIDYKLESFVLCTEKMNESHTSENVSLRLKDIANMWNVNEKIVAVTTDNGANISKSIHMCKWTWIPCFAHTLNLVVHNSLCYVPELENIVAKCRKIVTHFKHSTRSKNKLEEIQSRLKYPQLKLLQDVPTRWNSTYLMIERFIKVRAALSVFAVSSEVPSEVCNEIAGMSANEWDILSGAANLLEVFQEATIEISTQIRVTSSKVIPMVAGIQAHLRESNACDTLKPVEQLKKKLLKEMEMRFKDVEKSHVLAFSTLLDPRFKNEGFLSETNVAETTRKLAKEAALTLQNNIAELNVKKEMDDGETMNEEIRQSNLWRSFRRKYSSSRKMTEAVSSLPTPQATLYLEVQSYLELPLLAKEQDPLEWWKEKGYQYFPYLAKYALKYLCIQATSVPSEREFSKAGNLISEKQRKLCSSLVNSILFLNANSKHLSDK